MNPKKVIVVFDALSVEVRLKIFRILVLHRKEGICPCDIASKLKIPRNTLSFHLSLLTEAELCTQERSGKNIIYKPNCNTIKKSANFLLEKCCENEEIC